MRILPTTVLAAVLCIFVPSWAGDVDSGNNPPWDNSAIESKSELIAFVGAPVFLEERAKNNIVEIKGPNGDILKRKIPALNTRYEARFDVLEVVAGHHDQPTIDFVAYNHYSRPYFHKPKHVLLFVEKREESWVHTKYLFYTVQRTTDGDWATCGDPYERHRKSNPDSPYVVETLSFIEPFVPILDPKDAIECKVGVRAADLYAFEQQTRFLPQRRKTICRERLAEQIEGLEWRFQNSVIDPCVESLGLQNLP